MKDKTVERGSKADEGPKESTAPVRDLLSWKSLSRTPVVLPKEAFSTLVSVCVLLSIVVAFFQEWMLILLIWGGLFFIVMLSKLPPEEVEHRITTQGIISMGHDYLWSQLGPFWFVDKGKYKMVHISEAGNVFGSLTMIVPPELPWEKLRDVLAKYLPLIEIPEKTRMDKAADWLAGKLSLEPKA